MNKLIPFPKRKKSRRSQKMGGGELIAFPSEVGINAEIRNSVNLFPVLRAE